MLSRQKFPTQQGPECRDVMGKVGFREEKEGRSGFGDVWSHTKEESEVFVSWG